MLPPNPPVLSKIRGAHFVRPSHEEASMPMPRRHVSVAIAMLLVSLPCLAAQKPYGGETPQAVVARLRAAADGKDMGEVMACLAPDARREMAMMMTAGVGMMVAFAGMGSEMAGGMAEGMAEGLSGEEMTAEQKAELEKGKREVEEKTAGLVKRYEAILEKHRITEAMNDDTPVPDEPEARRAALAKALANTDEIALITDLMAMMGELGGEEGMKSSPVDLGPEVTDYEIEGDRATAKAGDEVVRFVKVDGRWYVEPEEQSAPPAEEPSPESDAGAGDVG
jgi:hypothetical protein